MNRRRIEWQDLYNDNERLQKENKQLRAGYNFTNEMMAEENQIARTALNQIINFDLALDPTEMKRIANRALRDVGRI